MELDQLRHFLKAAELCSFTRAAQAVELSQPALSRSIGRLEEELGQPLFERQTRKISLTDAGKLLQTRAQQILALVDNTKSEICDDGQTGTIRVAAIPTIAPFMLPALLREFGDSHPNASVIVHEDTTDNLLKKLSEGAVDIAVLALPLSAKYLEIVELFEEELLLVLSKVHPLCAKKQIQLTDIEPLPFVLLGEAHCLTDNIVSFCRQKAFQPMSVESTSQLATVQELVSLNHGISLIPEMARAIDDSDQRVYRSISGTPPTRKIVMAFNPYRFQSRLVESFKKQLLDYSLSGGN